MENKRIFLSPPDMTGRELEYIQEVFESNYIAPVGEFIDRFEESIKSYTKTQNALALNSGTSAIHLALRVAGVGVGDRVLSSTFTFVGSVAPILYQGATPIFIDSNESWNLDPNLLKEAIENESPKALILTHLYGQSAKIDEITEICRENGVILIEDSAEALGAKFGGKSLGSFGEFGIFSFNGNKILTTSGGGILISQDESHHNHAKKLSTQAKEATLWYEHQELGYNYRMSNVLASIGVAQMEVLEERVEKKREIFSWYCEEFEGVDEVEFMPEIDGSFGTRWLTTITLKKTNPLKVIEALSKQNIESRPLWKPIHLQPLFKDAKVYDNGVSQELFERGLCLPSGTKLKRSDIKRIASTLKASLK